MKKSIFLLPAILVVLSLAAGCRNNSLPETGTLSLVLSTGRNAAGSFAEVTEVTVDVSANSYYYYNDAPMVLTSGIWQVNLPDLPVGQILQFEVHALDAEGRELFIGTRSYTLSSGGETITITMIPYTQTAFLPKVTRITRLAKVTLGQSAPVKIWVSGRTGETLTYEMQNASGDSGSFDQPSGSIEVTGGEDIISLNYTPGAAGLYRFSVLLINSQGNSVRTSFTMETVETSGALVASLLFPPVITALHGEVFEGRVDWAAVVSDDGDLEEVAYAWSFDGTGDAFVDPAVNPAVMNGYTPALAGTLALTVSDTDGLSSTLTLNLEAGALETIVEEPSLVLDLYQNLPTNGAVDWEFFTIGEESFLAVANYQNGSSYNIDSGIYRWNGTSFEEFQSIPTNGAFDWEAFTMGTESFLALANHNNGTTYDILSRIYQWNGTSFEEIQSIPTNGALDWEAFTIEEESFLVAANYYNSTMNEYNIDSVIYRWNGSGFEEFQRIATNGSRDWEVFTIGTDFFLATANAFNGSTWQIDSVIYKWDGTAFAEHQRIPTQFASDWKAFTIGTENYLAVANHYNGATYNVDSRIYRWNGVEFESIQNIATHGARDIEVFKMGTKTCLAVANHYDGSSYNTNSVIYLWDGSGFTEELLVPSSGGIDFKAFTIDNTLYLAMANQYNGSTYNLNSIIFEALWE